MKKTVLLLGVMMLLLSACGGKRADYNNAQKAFESGGYATAIAAFRTLGDYEDSAACLVKAIQAYAAQKIDAMGDAIDDRSTVEALSSLCAGLTPAEFAQISNAAAFEALFCAYIDRLGQNTQWEDALALIQATPLLSDACVERSLLSYARWASIASAEEHTKSRLKSPGSYHRYRASVSTPRQKDDCYTVEVHLNYGAANSFGAEIREDARRIVHFTIDPADKSVAFDCIGDPLDKLENALDKAGF